MNKNIFLKLVFLQFINLTISCKNQDDSLEDNFYIYNSKYHAVEIVSKKPIDTLKWDSIFYKVIELRKKTEKEFSAIDTLNRSVNFDWRNENKTTISFFVKDGILKHRIINDNDKIDSLDSEFIGVLNQNIKNAILIEDDEELIFDLTLPKVSHLKDSLGKIVPFPRLPQ
ncbi:hypothetical protein LXD69_02580 [Flavobacterium sediminilitoris]|uniref:Lipoprotein n=1 Tax=Flavobacterium sediminilitoris TaxID=2024526 RepID=A0ABY4HNI0_9FLAO|nr:MULTISPECIES: hypothetical protein [Flavobacterium]UOX34410.1 hypothetical protein LXD69_02580 [Flavobacterium sediminilitoris]